MSVSKSYSVLLNTSYRHFTEKTIFSMGRAWVAQRSITSGILSTEKCREYHGSNSVWESYFSRWLFCIRVYGLKTYWKKEKKEIRRQIPHNNCSLGVVVIFFFFNLHLTYQGKGFYITIIIIIYMIELRLWTFPQLAQLYTVASCGAHIHTLMFLSSLKNNIGVIVAFQCWVSFCCRAGKSSVCIPVFPLFWTPFLFRSPQSSEQSSLC